ncbi:MAG: OS_HP2 family (seleno)protein [Desulfopila sp.]
MLRTTMVVLVAILSAAGFALCPLSEAATGPKLRLPENSFRFDQIVEGMEVVHDFILHNDGDEVLHIIDMEWHCGCSAATGTSRILPGEKGHISVSFNSEGYGGQDIKEKVVVRTNDPQRPVFDLVITGKVGRFAKIRPQHVLLKGRAGTSPTQDVEILPNTEYPFTILSLQTRRDDLIDCRLVRRCDNESGKGCVLRVQNLKKDSGRYAEIITVQTDSAVQPSFPIFVVGRLQ